MESEWGWPHGWVTPHGPVLRKAPCLLQCSVATILVFFIFKWGPTPTPFILHWAQQIREQFLQVRRTKTKDSERGGWYKGSLYQMGGDAGEVGGRNRISEGPGTPSHAEESLMTCEGLRAAACPHGLEMKRTCNVDKEGRQNRLLTGWYGVEKDPESDHFLSLLMLLW